MPATFAEALPSANGRGEAMAAGRRRTRSAASCSCQMRTTSGSDTESDARVATVTVLDAWVPAVRDTSILTATSRRRAAVTQSGGAADQPQRQIWQEPATTRPASEPAPKRARACTGPARDSEEPGPCWPGLLVRVAARPEALSLDLLELALDGLLALGRGALGGATGSIGRAVAGARTRCRPSAPAAPTTPPGRPPSRSG